MARLLSRIRRESKAPKEKSRCIPLTLSHFRKQRTSSRCFIKKKSDFFLLTLIKPTIKISIDPHKLRVVTYAKRVKKIWYEGEFIQKKFNQFDEIFLYAKTHLDTEDSRLELTAGFVYPAVIADMQSHSSQSAIPIRIPVTLSSA